MKENEIFRESKHILTPIHIFRGVQTPNPRIYAPAAACLTLQIASAIHTEYAAYSQLVTRSSLHMINSSPSNLFSMKIPLQLCGFFAILCEN